MPFLLDLNFQNQKSRQNCVHVWGFCTWSSSHIYILCINIYVTNIMDTNFSLSFSLLNNVDLKQLTLPITPVLSLVWLGPWECAPIPLYPHLLPSPRLSTSRSIGSIGLKSINVTTWKTYIDNTTIHFKAFFGNLLHHQSRGRKVEFAEFHRWWWWLFIMMKNMTKQFGSTLIRGQYKTK